MFEERLSGGPLGARERHTEVREAFRLPRGSGEHAPQGVSAQRGQPRATQQMGEGTAPG
jgi:hypothetical protein